MVGAGGVKGPPQQPEEAGIRMVPEKDTESLKRKVTSTKGLD